MNIWDQLVDCICRPPRDVYSPHELLGGVNQTFLVGQMECTRIDFDLTNKQGLKICCSHYLPLDAKSQDGQLPVVVYCHCNSGSRRDAEEAVYHLLPCGVGVVAFDFTGSGLSDGKWVTLGAHEVEDLAVVVQHLRAQGGVSSIGLWGRSMGAVTALLYSHLDPDIAGMVLDSPFSRLTDLMLEIVVSQRLPIPKVMLKLALRLMRNSVRRKAGADINTVSPLDVVARAAIPAMFGHGEEDSFINMQHSVKLYEAYNSAAAAPVYKNMVRFKGDHNHPRPSFFYSSVCCFFHQQLKLDQVLLGGNPADTQQLMQYGSLTLSSAHDMLDRANGFINTPWSLEPVSSMTPDEAAAAAAAATAMLAEDASNGGGGSSGGGAGSNSGSVGGGCPRLVVPSRACLQSSSGLSPGRGGVVSPGRGGVVHISEGGLNSPRASATRDRASWMLVAVDAGASSSSGSSGGGMGSRAGGAAAAAAIGIPGSGAVGIEHKLGSAGPGSPISPMYHHQHHRQQQQHHHHHPQQQQRMPHSGLISAEELRVLEAVHEQYSQQQSPRWQSPLAAGAAASRGPYTHQGIMQAHSSEELFTIGSRGAAADVSRQGIPQPAEDAQHSRQHNAAAAAAAASGVQEQGGAGDADRAARAQSGPGSFVAAGGQHLKWLFKRTCSSTAGSTPSTSPAASDGALWRSRSTGAGLANGRASGAAADGAAAGAAARSGLGPNVQEVFSDPLPQLPARLHHSHTTGEFRGAGPAASRDAAVAAAAGMTAGSGAVTAAAPAGSHAAPLGQDRAAAAAAAGGAYDDASMDSDLAAAIAASLTDQQQEQQQQEQPWLSQQPQQQQQQQVPRARLPRSLEEEEQMLRQAIALSLATSDAGGPQPQQYDLQQEQQEQLTTSSMLQQRHSQAATQQQPRQLAAGVSPRDHSLDREQQQRQQAQQPVHGLGMSTVEPGQHTAGAGPQQQLPSQ